jgi:hypothetical protein
VLEKWARLVVGAVSAAVSVGAEGAVGVGVICAFRDVVAAVEALTSVYWTRINEVNIT